MNNSRKHIELLDYVRAVAIFSVLLFHTLGSTFGYEDLPWHGWVRSFSVPVSFLWLLPFSFGQVGVAIFFVVSGFCIHLSFQQQEKDWRSFWIRRFWRIYPAYIAAVAVAVLFLTTNSRLELHNWPIWKQLAAHLFLVHNISPGTFTGINGSFWSLAVEAQLYLLYPLLLVSVGRFGWRQTMVVLGCCEFFIRGVDGVVQTLGAENTIWGHISWLFAASPLGYWFSWTLGARLADAYLKNEILPFTRVPTLPILALALLSYFIKPMLPFMFVLSAVVTTIAVSRLLGKAQSGARMDTEQPIGWTPKTARVFSLNVFRTIGLWSYSIYLLHQPLLNAVSLLMSNVIPGSFRSGIATFMYFVATWLVILPISGLWFHVFELPGIALGKWIIQKRVPDKNSATPLVYRPKTSFYHMAGVLVIVVAGILLLTTKLNERDSESELELAEFLTAKHRYVAALKHYQAALDHDENSVDALNNAAWMLSTAPNPRLRDGKTAVELANKACELTGYKKPFYIVTLAAAYAEAGRFDEAITNSQTARVLALKHGQIEMATRIDQLLELYQAGKPFHETADSR
jgi:peptidoglycan/LPS O-acetylase OafA/YrhL